MWHIEDDGLTRTFNFDTFVEAFAFMTKVALTAEKIGHHPTFINTYGEVTIKLSTHEGDAPVTDKDHFMAAAIDNIYGD
jgi:4a-hydroxytetrahydrobiopterin dehydratase